MYDIIGAGGAGYSGIHSYVFFPPCMCVYVFVAEEPPTNLPPPPLLPLFLHGKHW